MQTNEENRQIVGKTTQSVFVLLSPALKLYQYIYSNNSITAINLILMRVILFPFSSQIPRKFKITWNFIVFFLPLSDYRHFMVFCPDITSANEIANSRERKKPPFQMITTILCIYMLWAIQEAGVVTFLNSIGNNVNESPCDRYIYSSVVLNVCELHLNSQLKKHNSR